MNYVPISGKVPLVEVSFSYVTHCTHTDTDKDKDTQRQRHRHTQTQTHTHIDLGIKLI